MPLDLPRHGQQPWDRTAIKRSSNSVMSLECNAASRSSYRFAGDRKSYEPRSPILSFASTVQLDREGVQRRSVTSSVTMTTRERESARSTLALFTCEEPGCFLSKLILINGLDIFECNISRLEDGRSDLDIFPLPASTY